MKTTDDNFSFKYYVYLYETDRVVSVILSLNEIEEEYYFVERLEEKVYDFLEKEICSCEAKGRCVYCNGDWAEVIRVMQRCRSTSIFDKNGIEIYEGDILEGSGVKSEVVYDTDTASFITLTNGNKARMSVYDTAQWVSVIGNIYENPELRSNK